MLVQGASFERKFAPFWLIGVENGFNVGEIRTERDEDARAEIEMVSELHPVLGLFGWTIK